MVDPRLGAEGYSRADSGFTGRATIPVLWDTRRGTIVNNESADILSILNQDFGALAAAEIDLQLGPHLAYLDSLTATV